MDIDGTLIDSKARVHPQDAQILENFPESIQPVITTGRILHSVKGVLQENGLFKVFNFPLPGVFMNGGIAYLPHEELCTIHAFAPQTREAIIRLAMDFPDTAFTFFTIGCVYLVNPNSFGEHISRLHYLDAHESDPSEVPEEVIKVMILESDPQVLKQIQNAAQDLNAEMAHSLPYAYEINPSGVNKANTLITLLKTMGLDKLPIYVAGDAENDLALFDLSQTSFAPATAQQSVLDRADHIIQHEKEGLLNPILAYLKSS